mmetsp:Transcript_32259/g.63021  ORF Transcript_32259/g.63021 Transcript_32259/m.63021 type:complete len:357 (-) Transcript_32259:119-1189(-)
MPGKVQSYPSASVVTKSQPGASSLYPVYVVLLLIICCAESVAFSLYNKYLFSGPLRAPILVTATHQVCCFLGAFTVWQLSPPSFYTRKKITSGKMWTKILLIPIAFVANIGLNNLSLKFTTLALNQLIRSFSPVAIAITSYAIEGKTQSTAKALTLALLVAGVVMGVLTSPDFEMIGILICSASVLGQAMGIVMTALVMGGAKVSLHVFDVLLYATLPSILALIPMAGGLGEFSVLEKAIEEHGAGTILGLILAGGTLAFTYNLFCTIFIKLTSSVYYGVTGGFRCSISIAMSFYFFPQKVTALSVTGIVIAMVAFIANSFFTMRERLQTNKQKPGLEVTAARIAEKERLLADSDA